MTADIYFHEQAYFNKWLKELTDNEYAHFIYMLEEYASQQRTEGIREGFEAARERGIRKRTYDGVGEVPVYGNLYPTVEDYLNSKQ